MCKQLNGWFVLVSAVLASCMAQAAVKVKANNTTDLNVGSSWSPTGVPGVMDMAQWDSTVTGANSVLLGGDLSFRGMTVANPGGAVTIGGANTLTLGGEGLIMRSGSGDLTLSNANLTLLTYAGQIWDIVTGSIVTVNPTTVTRGYGSSIGFVNSGTVTSATFANDATGMIGPWARTGAGTATRYAAVSGGNVGPYVGGTAAATAAGVTDTTGTVNYDVAAVGALGAGASFNTLRYTGGGGTISNAYAANGLMNAGSGMLSFIGATTIGASKELVFTSPDSTRKIGVSGVISDNPGGASGITVAGGGQVDLYANNTYSGQTVVGAGRLYINKADALGSTNGNTVIHVIGSSVTGGILQVSGNLTIAEPLTFVGPGDGSPWSQAFQSSGGTNTLTGPITIASPGGVRLTASGGGTGININGPITRTTAGSTLILGGGGSGGAVNVNYPISNNWGSVNLHSGPGTITFNVANNAIGDMNVQYQHMLKLGVSDALSRTASLQVGGNNTQTGTAPQGSFDMAGFDQTVNSFYGDGAFASAPPSTRAVTNSAPGLSTLTTGYSNGSGTFNGMFGGNVAYVKLGTGTETLCGPNFYTGGTTVNGGTLVLSNAVNHGSLTVNGGIFRFPSALTVNGTLSGSGGVIDTLSSGSVLTVNQTTNTTYAGSITNAGSLVKSGPGTLTLFGFNSYSGGTTVSQGTLVFGKTTSKSATGSVVLSAGANLGLGLGGAGGFGAADVDALWAGTLPGVTLDDTSLIGIDASVTNVTYDTSQSTRGLVKTGTNTLTLTGSNDYPGSTYIQAGVLAIPTTASLPGWDTAGRYWVSRDAGLAVGNAVGDADLATILATGNFADGGCIGFDTTVSNRTYTGILSNTVNGALGLVKVGTNTLTLTANSAYDGNTVINGGTVVIKSSTALGSATGYTVVNRVGGTNAWMTDATGQLRLDGSAGALTLDENFFITGDQQYGYGGAMRSVAGNNVINGWIVVGVSGRIGVDGGNLTLNGLILRANTSYNPMLVLNPGTGYLIVSNRIEIGTGLVNCHSGGTVVFCSTNNVWGSMQIQYGGIARLGVDEGLSSGKRLTMGNPEPGNGRFDLYGYSQTIGGLLEYGTAASKPNNIITNGRPANVSTLTISQSAGTIDYFSGRLQGALGLVKAGAANSSLTLAGANTFVGDTGLAGGALVVSNQLALQNSTLNATNANGTVRFGAGLSDFTLGGLAGSVGFGLTNTLGSAVILTVGNNNASTVFDGSLSGAGGLTKVGAGTLTLSGANTYSGATAVSQGTLALGCNGALSASSPIVLNGGTLDPGNTLQTLGPLTVSANSTVALGDGSGSLAFDDSSAQTWTGLVNITGLWTPTAIRVGTGSSSLSGDQIHRFSYNGERVWVQVDASGYLWKMSGTLLQLK